MLFAHTGILKKIVNKVLSLSNVHSDVEGESESFRQFVHHYYDEAYHQTYSKVRSEEITKKILKKAFLLICNHFSALSNRDASELLWKTLEDSVFQYFKSVNSSSELKREFLNNLQQRVKPLGLQSNKGDDIHIKSVINDKLQGQLIHKCSSTDL